MNPYYLPTSTNLSADSAPVGATRAWEKRSRQQAYYGQRPIMGGVNPLNPFKIPVQKERIPGQPWMPSPVGPPTRPTPPPKQQVPLPTPPRYQPGISESERARQAMAYQQQLAEYYRQQMPSTELSDIDPRTRLLLGEERINRIREGRQRSREMIQNILSGTYGRVSNLQEKMSRAQQAEALATRMRQEESAQMARQRYSMQDFARDYQRLQEDRERMASPEYFAQAESDYLKRAESPIQRYRLPESTRQNIMQSFASRGMYGTDAMNEALRRAEEPYTQASAAARMQEEEQRMFDARARMGENEGRRRAYEEYRNQMARQPFIPDWMMTPQAYYERAYEQLFG